MPPEPQTSSDRGPEHIQKLALPWAFGRVLLLLLVLFLLRHPLLNAVESVFDIVGITEFVIDRAATPMTRLLLAVVAWIGFFLTAGLCARVIPKRAYPVSLAIAGLLSAAFVWKAGGSQIVTGLVVLVLATNWAPIDGRNPILSRMIAIPPAVGEVFFASRFLDWVRSLLWRNAGPPSKVPRLWPGAVIAALALAGLLPGKKLIRYERALRSGPDVRVIATGDFNDIAFDAKENRLLVTGHGVQRVLGYDAADLLKRPLKADVETGYAQSFEFDPVNRELYIYNSEEEEIQVLDTGTLALKRRIAAPNISPGDSWVALDPISNTLTVASEADEQKGSPIVVFDRASGSMVETRAEEAGNLLVHPDQPILYMSFFRRVGGVIAYDLKKREVLAKASTDARMDRMAYDPLHKQLLIASPAEGRIQQFDALTLSPLGSFRAIPGVRVIAVDAPNRVMLVGSLVTGCVAMIGLDDYEVRHSWYLGPWLRSIKIAPGKGVAYVSSENALYELRYLKGG